MNAKLLKLFLSECMTVGLYKLIVRCVMRDLGGKNSFSYYEPKDLKINVVVAIVLSTSYILFLMYVKNHDIHNIYVTIVAAIILFSYWVFILGRYFINRKFFNIYDKIRHILIDSCFHEMISCSGGGLTNDDFISIADKSLIRKYVNLIRYEKENPGYRFKEIKEHSALRNDLNTAYNYLLDILPDSRKHEDGWGQYESKALESYNAMCHH